MTVDVKQTGEDVNSGLGWARRSLVCALLAFLGGVVFTPSPGVVLLIGGILAVTCGCISLRRIPKSQSVWYAKWVAAGGIVLGCFLVLVGLNELFTPNRAIIRAKKITSLATATALESAINNFYTEYGKLPDVGTRVITNSPGGLKMLHILLGLDVESSYALNSKSIRFLVVKEGKNKKNGLIYAADGKSVEGLYDPWGNPYTVELDDRNKEHLQFTIASKPIDLKGRRVAVYSPGADKKLGTADDITTW